MARRRTNFKAQGSAARTSRRLKQLRKILDEDTGYFSQGRRRGRTRRRLSRNSQAARFKYESAPRSRRRRIRRRR